LVCFNHLHTYECESSSKKNQIHIIVKKYGIPCRNKRHDGLELCYFCFNLWDGSEWACRYCAYKWRCASSWR
jgi:hypothetical protein